MLYIFIFMITFFMVTLCFALCKAAAREEIFSAEIEEKRE
ncbi:hypothetical protein SAMN02745163_04089 [Clostridium cavendishii DSM 21758]|uniref:Uncharacterized protein n=1 Tax=Clostridium cavendishii DSM 21758 TaxID=1121302 RepID=A0A1M6TRG6_9CLOT|nr:hypothetical protein SAMN02745163_04089 [Clostridium cavendishii DSM 21758]